MVKAHFIFTKYKNSFKVEVPNLEKLTVTDIQIIETFVEMRKGMFDFNTYSFVIPKKLDFQEFTCLLESINIEAHCEENIIQYDEKPRVGFGQYKGMQYFELPNSYMLWLKSNYHGKDRDIVEKELKRRKL